MQFKKPSFWDNQKKTLASFLLFPFSIVYLSFFWILKEIIIFKKHQKSSIPVICVGNIYLGGTGKTPLVRKIFKIFKSLDKNPAIIKKYYNYLDDEIKMLQDTGKTYTYNDRKKSISLSISNNHDVVILDDGFQDFSIKPDFSIICFNSKQMIGNGLIIPSGPLREKLNAIQRANCIVINGDKNLEFEKKLLKNAGNKELHIFYSNYKIVDIEKFRNKEITAFAGIGNPSNFFDLLKKNNLNIKKTFSFPDHHKYSKNDFQKILGNKLTEIVTTEKDYFRMSDIQKKECDFVRVSLEIEDEEKFKEIVKSYL